MNRPRLLSLLAAIAACGGSASVPEPRMESPAVSQLPICETGADLARFDGERIMLVGIYRKRVVPTKQGKPATQFYGQVQIELTGKAADYDETSWEAATAVVQVGTDSRPDEEVERLADKHVAVEGRLVLHPPLADPNVASRTPGPTLFEPGPVTLHR